MQLSSTRDTEVRAEATAQGLGTPPGRQLPELWDEPPAGCHCGPSAVFLNPEPEPAFPGLPTSAGVKAKTLTMAPGPRTSSPTSPWFISSGLTPGCPRAVLTHRTLSQPQNAVPQLATEFTPFFLSKVPSSKRPSLTSYIRQYTPFPSTTPFVSSGSAEPSS